MIQPPGFVEKIDKLKYEGKILIADALCIGVTDEELDSYIAYNLRNYMRRGEIAFNHLVFYKAEEKYIWEQLQFAFPDITNERFQRIIALMVKHGYAHKRKGFVHSDRVPRRNKLLD